MKAIRDCQICWMTATSGLELEKSSSRLLCFLGLLALIGVGVRSASGPEPSFETAYSTIGASVKWPGQLPATPGLPACPRGDPLTTTLAKREICASAVKGRHALWARGT